MMRFVYHIPMPNTLADTAHTYLRHLCLDIPSRAVGSPGNRAATDFFRETVARFGFQAECHNFPCLDWTGGGADLLCGGAAFDCLPSPYSPGGSAFAPLVVVSTVEELEAAEARGSVLLLRGPIAREPLMPKNFPFYNPDEHRRIYAALEAAAPAAVLTAASPNPAMAGALYPYPMIEDGEFDIPSAYMSEAEAGRLAEYAAAAGGQVTLTIRAERRPSTACNVVARRGDPSRRLVFFGHIDAKAGTPGAIDNAAGVATLLLLAELLQDYTGDIGVELTALNGEDYYSNPGEQDYLARHAGRFGEIAFGVNVDGAGHRQGATAYSLYECPPELAGAIRGVFSAQPGLVEGPPWFQGDHGLFLRNGVPALAVTSERAVDLLSGVIHTAQDTPEVVDPARLAALARALRDVVARLAPSQA
jgi:aminopeptidase YwaD